MQHKIDYLSYTYVDAKVGSAPSYRLQQTFLDGLPDYIEIPNGWVNAPKRQGFDGGLNIDNHTFIFYSHQGLVLVEHTGQGCDWLEAQGKLLATVSAWSQRLTRIDIATDIQTETRPSEFRDQSEAKTIKAQGFQKSSSGETCYIGSKSSERCCKVYRYDGKHPRKDLLRIEYTYRKEQAKVIGEMLKSMTIAEIALRSSTRYGWKHDAWKNAVSGSFEGIKAFRPERRHGKTVAWIYSQCIPAIAKLVKLGTLDLEDVITEIRKQSR